MAKKIILLVDGLINLGLGAMLMFFPAQLISALHLPRVEIFFYVNLLGAVLFGIGIALLIERFAGNTGITGLGIGGAIPINLCAVGVLIFWLLFSDLEISQAGTIFLWSVTIIVFGIVLAEIFTKVWNR